MKRIHIIGGKNQGKTTLIGELVAEFSARGLCVGTIKHTHHHHELDTPGKDSHRHRESGAAVVGIMSRSQNAVFWPHADGTDPSQQADTRYADFAPAYSECDLVLVEGDSATTAPKLEVWRSALSTPPMAERMIDIHGIVTDDAIETGLPIVPRADVAAVADFILQISANFATVV